MIYTIRIVFGAIMAQVRDIEQQLNRALGPWLCPRRY